MSSTLAACSNGELALDDTYVPATHYERYPIEVTKGPVKTEISSQYGTLQPKQINTIVGFGHSAVSSRSSRITILRPSGGGASGKVAKETYQLLVRSGISPGMIVQKTYPGSSKGSVQLSYIRSFAVTEECGDWSSDLTNTSRNEPYPNLGCSIQSNIAAMVANPEQFNCAGTDCASHWLVHVTKPQEVMRSTNQITCLHNKSGKRRLKEF